MLAIRLFLLSSMFFVSLCKATSLQVVVPQDVLVDYHKFLEGQDPLTITNFAGEHSRRDVVEVVFIQQALKKGGVTQPIELIAIDSYQRILTEIKKGAAILSATSSYHTDLQVINKSIYISVPVIEMGEFEAGLYTSKDNTNAMSAKNLSDIQALSSVTNKAWTADYRTLNALKLKWLEETILWTTMFKLVHKGRVDFVLAPFQQSEDLSLELEGKKLVPIPNLKVILNASRHFAVAKKHPQGKKVFNALNTGIRLLKKQGKIKKAYEQSGFFNPRVKTWTNINP